MTMPAGIDFATTWPEGDNGLVQLKEWLQHYPDTRLVVIDTLPRFWGLLAPTKEPAYLAEYRAVAALQKAATARAVPFLALTHTRKPKGNGHVIDPLDEVQQTSGLTGAADAILVLQRPRHSKEAKLFVTGRDVEEKEILLRWNPVLWQWSLTDPPAMP